MRFLICSAAWVGSTECLPKATSQKQIVNQEALIEMRSVLQSNYKQIIEQQQSYNTLLVLDRNLDLVTPLATAFTFEGVIHEVGEVRKQIVKTQFKGKEKFFKIQESDELFRQYRDMNISQACRELKQLNQDQRKTVGEKAALSQDPQRLQQSLQELNSMVAFFGKVLNLCQLSGIISQKIDSAFYRARVNAENNLILGLSINDALDVIEQFSALQRPKQQVLKVMCLSSVISNGVKPKILDEMKRIYCDSYGVQELLALERLQLMGLLESDKGASEWQSRKQKLKLVDPQVDFQDIRHPHHFFISALVPLAYRFLQRKLQNFQQDPLETLSFPHSWDKTEQRPNQTKQLVVILIIGGVTSTEARCIQQLSKQGLEVLVVSTQLINWKNLVACRQEQRY